MRYCISTLIAFYWVAAATAQSGVPSQYTEGEVSITTESGRDTLFGTLLLPDAIREGKVTAILLIPGSGPTDRDGNTTMASGKNNSLKMLAEALQAQGIASLRIDKRGIGKSQFNASMEEIRFDKFTDDAVAWLEYLDEHPSIDKVVAAGHSQGALVAAIAAEQTPSVSGYISLAGTGRRIDAVLRQQLKEQLVMLPNLYEAADTVLTYLREERVAADYPPMLQSLFAPQIQPFLISWIKYDPIEVLQSVNAPKLFVFGSTDLQVKPADEVEALEAAFPEATVTVLEGMNHVFKAAPEERMANIAAYTDPDLPLVEGLVEGVVEFVRGL